MSALRDTIAAPASPSGVGAIAVVRVSGSCVPNLVQTLLGKSSLVPRRMTLCTVRRTNGLVLDSLLACYFPAPNSYTGEDMLELFPHGNPLLVRDLLDLLRSQPGVRLARPGEFTQRAFELGKLDLVQAEAVGDLLRATEEAGLCNAQRLLGGALSRPVHDLAKAVLEMSALMELETDFAEEEADADLQGWLDRLLHLHSRIAHLQGRMRQENLRRGVPALVFYGPPNAGKSSLVNALLGENRLLVSARPGTTRDWVEVRILLPGGEARILDTAGIASTFVDELDALAQQSTRARIADADLAVLVLDCTRWEAEDKELFEQAKKCGRPIVLCKSELPRAACPDENLVMQVSAHRGTGLSELLQELSGRLFLPIPEGEDFWLGSLRQGEQLQMAGMALERCTQLLREGTSSPEILAFELQQARNHLRAIIGHFTAEDVLRHIFAGFCIGK